MTVGLLDIMRRAKNAMSAFETSLRIRTNNASNLATAGYKTLKHSFKTVFNDVASIGFEGIGDVGPQHPVQYGSGVAIANISLDFSQGALGEGGDLDCAISGRGLFVVSPDGGETHLYTRAGEFSIDTTGDYIVDSSGRMLLGTTAGGGEGLSPIKTDGYTDLGWDDGGILVANYAAHAAGTGVGIPLYQITLADFANVEGLVQYDGTTFQETVASGSVNATGKSGTDSFGTVEPQQLEKSNVFFIGETIDSLEVQRAMSAALTAIKIASDQIAQVSNKLFG